MTAVLAIIGRFCVNITFNIGLQYGAELIPTAVRAQGIVSFKLSSSYNLVVVVVVVLAKIFFHDIGILSDLFFFKTNRKAYVHIAGYVAAIISPYIVDLVMSFFFIANFCTITMTNDLL